MEEREKTRREKNASRRTETSKGTSKDGEEFACVVFLYFGSAFLSVNFHPLNNRLEAIVC